MSERGHDSSGSMRWLLTYADMITLLLAFFVILYAISKLDAKKYQALATSLQGAFGGQPPAANAPGVGGPTLPPQGRADGTQAGPGVRGRGAAAGGPGDG